MRTDTLFAIAVLILVGVVVVRFFESWRDHRTDRLRLLEKLLADPELDGATKRAALATLDGGSIFQRWMFGAGWLSFFVGTALLLFDSHGSELPGAMLVAVGFGLVSLPLALREVEARRGT